MAKMDFSKLAKLCIDAEMEHAFAKLSGEPTVALGIEGNRLGEISIHMITGPPGEAHLMGTPLKYHKKTDKTSISMKCSDIRRFYGGMGWMVEDFVYEGERIVH